MEPIRHFKFCPSCGQPPAVEPAGRSFHCPSCGFVYYFNPATAAAAFVVDAEGRALLIRRAKDPAKGKLALPGGFVDVGETCEAALRRELREEVNVELTALEYLSSHPNFYPYKGVTYPVLDFFFVARARDAGAVAALDAVESYCWLQPAAIDPEDIAFPSMKAALEVYLTRVSGQRPDPAKGLR